MSRFGGLSHSSGAAQHHALGVGLAGRILESLLILVVCILVATVTSTSLGDWVRKRVRRNDVVDAARWVIFFVVLIVLASIAFRVV